MTTFTESFNKADGAGLGPDLTWSGPNAQWATVSSQGVINNITATNIANRADSADTGSPDMYVQLVIPDFGASSYADVGLCARMSADRLTYYALKRTTTGDYEVRRNVAGAGTTLIDVALALALPETWRLEVEGDEIRVYRNDVLINSTTDAGGIATGNHGGLDGFRNSTASSRRVIFDSFEVGSLGAEPIVLGTAQESDIAQALSGQKISSITGVVSQSAMLDIFGVKASGLSLAQESSQPLPIAGSKTASLTPIVEQSNIQEMFSGITASLGDIVETSEMLPFVDTETNLLGTVEETFTIRPLPAQKIAVLGTIQEVDSLIGFGLGETINPIAVQSEILDLLPSKVAELGHITTSTQMLHLFPEGGDLGPQPGIHSLEVTSLPASLEVTSGLSKTLQVTEG